MGDNGEAIAEFMFELMTDPTARNMLEVRTHGSTVGISVRFAIVCVSTSQAIPSLAVESSERIACVHPSPHTQPG